MGCGTSVKTENQTKKSEKAIKAAILIQRWYRFYTARLEMRRRYSLSIFQSIEYAEEQAQLQLSNFFNFMMDHFAQINGQGPDLISDIFNSKEGQKQHMDYEMVDVPDTYDGPRLSFPLTVSDTNSLLGAFKQEKQLHARYVLQLFHETKKFLKQMPNVVHVSSSYSKGITICGDLHGKLDDLLLIFYKNGLPSPENPYLFNGDFVDRGKNSVEILIILFAFLLVYPNHLHLNRGNHEDPIMNLRYGFTKEILQKYKCHGQKMICLLEDIYSQLPFATIIDSKILILHGGISDSTDLDFLSSIERCKFKSALRPPKSQKANKPNPHKPDMEMVTSGQRKPSNTDECYSPSLFSSSNEPSSMVENGVSHNGILEIHYLDSKIQLPDMTPDLTAIERDEWKQIVDILWSDPRNQNGCLPNSFRGGGCYFGPDISTQFLNKYNFKMLIRSHECKQEGYEICHSGKVVTIFSASNYYDEGSNRGAYLKLSPDLTMRFVQYQVSKCTRKLTLHQRVSAVEDSALKALQEKIYAHKTDLIKAFKEHDPKGTGTISTSEWASSVEAVLHLDLPWRTLRSRLVRLTSDGNVEYLSCFEDLQMERPIKTVEPSLIEILHRYRADLEIIFNIIDKDHSGLISIEEFRQTWKLFSTHLHIDIDDSTIDDLAHSIDSNKDGGIDFHEFLEAFRVVKKFDIMDSKNIYVK
ncbi:serine/threonine-protein phosphatase with EF-hands 1 [Spea bombifrons]|uniref:serine/threonine-protein phosphatase with EF-hands 1 n=1 Tax=Spea bombifrons TaxID=233779 RepID=UPI00234ADD87|nr:serine/threonine-protein phosphatase with EF-hands 1 [Spea bombifrons]